MNKVRMKPLVAAAIPLLTVLGSYIGTGEINALEWSLAITGLLTAGVVFILDILNIQGSGVLAWTRAIGAALTPLLSAAVQALFITGSITRAQVATAILGALTALVMAYVQNTPDP